MEDATNTQKKRALVEAVVDYRARAKIRRLSSVEEKENVPEATNDKSAQPPESHSLAETKPTVASVPSDHILPKSSQGDQDSMSTEIVDLSQDSDSDHDGVPLPGDDDYP